MLIKILLTVFTSVLLVDQVWLLENGLARKPPMGWMSWGYYMCADKCHNANKCLNEELILSVADEFFNGGYQEAGYKYIIIDDCWSEKTRDGTGRLVPDRRRFPRGMKFLADYIHSRGLKFGMYTNIAAHTCMRYPGSRGHFEVDANTFAEFEVDYLKVDGCFVEEWFLDTAYIDLGRALNKTGRPMVYACSWPYYKKFIHNHTQEYDKAQKYCNVWRNYHDVSPSWYSVVNIIRYYEDHYGQMHTFHGPGGWNDPDMLMLGTERLTASQSRVQLGVFAMLSAPLLISCDMRKITRYEKSILLNENLLAIAQDPLGIMAKPYKNIMLNELTLWVKRHLPMKGDKFYSFSFALVNLEPQRQAVSLTLKDYGLDSDELYSVLDVFDNKFLPNVTRDDTMDFEVMGNDIKLYSFYPI